MGKWLRRIHFWERHVCLTACLLRRILVTKFMEGPSNYILSNYWRGRYLLSCCRLVSVIYGEALTMPKTYPKSPKPLPRITQKREPSRRLPNMKDILAQILGLRCSTREKSCFELKIVAARAGSTSAKSLNTNAKTLDPKTQTLKPQTLNPKP